MSIWVSPEDNLAALLAEATPGARFMLAAGTHVLADTLYVGVPLALTGGGGGAVLTGSGAAPLLAVATEGVVDVTGVAFVHTAEPLSPDTPGFAVVVATAGEVRFVGCRFSGGRLGAGATGGEGLVVSQYATAKLTDCVADRNEDAGLAVRDDARADLESCVFRGNAVGACFGGRTGGLVRGCTAENNLRSGFMVTDSAQPTLAENTIRYNGVPGVAVADQARPLVVDNKLAPADMAETGSRIEPVADALRDPENVLELLALPPIGLELGEGLVRFVESQWGGDLMDRLSEMRVVIGLTQGFITPGISVRDNPELARTHYRVMVRGLPAATGALQIEHRFTTGEFPAALAGIPAVDPVTGVPGLWVGPDDAEQAEAAGLTLRWPAAVLAAHVEAVVRRHASEILSVQEVVIMCASVAQRHARVLDELVPERLNYGGIHQVLVRLLREGVSIRDLPAILEPLLEAAWIFQDTGLITEAVRKRITRTLCQDLADATGLITLLTFEPEVELHLAELLVSEPDLPARTALRRRHEVLETVASLLADHPDLVRPVFVVSPGLRPAFAACLWGVYPQARVVATDELHPAYRYVDVTL